jgi:hypothetical protein
MKFAVATDSALNLALGVAVVMAAVSLSDHFRGVRTELGQVQLASLSPELEERLANLDDRLFLTYYVSARERMPSHMRRVERDVTDLLAAMQRFAPDRVDYQIVDPDGDETLIAFAARRKVAPLRVRHVTRDSFTEQEIWSTLTLTCGPAAPARIDGVGPEHLPRLQALMVAQLDQLRQPRAPLIALAAPATGYAELREALSELGEVVDVDLSGGAALPSDADLLFWMDPGVVRPETLADLERFLDKGRSAIVAGSRLHSITTLDEDGFTLELQRTDFDAEALWGTFGLRPVDGLMLDERHRAVTLADGSSVPAPHRITSLANHQDFQKMAFEVNGNLLFEAPTPLALDSKALAAWGWTAEILATTSDRTWSRPVEASFVSTELPDRVGDARPKLPLLVWLRPSDPWRGSVVACAGTTPFQDGSYSLGGVAHRRLVSVLVATLGSADRLVMGRSGVHRPDPLPAQGPGSRLFWRVMCALLLPLLMLGLGVWRAGRRGSSTSSGVFRWVPPVAWRGAAGFAVVGSMALLPGLSVDLTADGLNALHPETLRLAGAAGPIEVDLVFSSPERLPPVLRQQVRRVGDLLDALANDGVELEQNAVHPEDLSEAEQQEWIEAGVSPFQVASLDEEVTTVRTLWSALRITAAGRSVVLGFPDSDSFENLEFRLAFALWRITTGERPHIAFVSDTPRLSAAEAHQIFQTQGLIAPLGKDVYSAARDLLSAADFRVTHVDPRQPIVPDDIDLMVWLQPRRSIGRMLPFLAEHLYRGGRALLAVQHFNMQARQFRGRGFDFVHWPQPQTNDLNLLYLPELGIHLVRQVLFDELNLPITDEAQLNASDRRDFRAMQSSLPFVIRAVGAHFDQSSPITRRLGDQAFVWASAIDVDESRLDELGLSATTLISTSERSWTFDWSGGYLPPDSRPRLLEGPEPGEDGTPAFEGQRALMIDVRGRFPWPTHSFDASAASSFGGPDSGSDAGPPPYPLPEPVGTGASGRLVLIGDSELFKTERLVDLRPDFRGDHLLLNAVADLALPAGLSSVMARRPVARGFDVPPEEERLRWRALVLAAAPAAFVLLGLFRRLLRGGP